MFGSNQTPKTKTPARLNLVGLETREVPVVTAFPDFYPLAGAPPLRPAETLTVPAANGVLSNDFSTTNKNAVLVANKTYGPFYENKLDAQGNNTANVNDLPTLVLFANGSFNLTVPGTYDSSFGAVIFKYQATDTLTGENSIGNVRVTVSTGTTSRFFATGAGAGSTPRVRVYESGTGLLRYDFLAYEENFTGGVRVATGDLTGDGIDDIVTAPARGGGPRIKVFDGASGVLLEDFFAVDPAFRGGAYVAVGDVDGPRVRGTRNDLIVGAGEGGGPRVTVYNGLDINTVPIGTGAASKFSTSVIADFFAYDIRSRAGVQVASGNVNGLTDINRRDFIITSPGQGGGPHIRVFDGRKLDRSPLAPGDVFPAPNEDFSQNPFPPSDRAFFAFSPDSRSGVSVAVGQFRGNQQADIVIGTGDGTPVVRVFDGKTSTFLREFTVPAADTPSGGIAGASNNGSGAASNFGSASTGGGFVTTGAPGQQRGGARVAVADRNNDGLSDIVVGLGPGSAPRVRIFDGNTFTELDSFTAYPANFLGGVFVGGNSL